MVSSLLMEMIAPTTEGCEDKSVGKPSAQAVHGEYSDSDCNVGFKAEEMLSQGG